jgi:hypothetical protein
VGHLGRPKMVEMKENEASQKKGTGQNGNELQKFFLDLNQGFEFEIQTIKILLD